jgi:hypothetical protein
MRHFDPPSEKEPISHTVQSLLNVEAVGLDIPASHNPEHCVCSVVKSTLLLPNFPGEQPKQEIWPVTFAK